MRIFDVTPQPFLSKLRCDRCEREASKDDPEFSEFLSMSRVGGYASIFGDGGQIELELCQHCVRDLAGEWIRTQAGTWLRDPSFRFSPTVDARGQEEKMLLNRCVEVARDSSLSARDQREANVFETAAGSMSSLFPAACEALGTVSQRYFAEHPEERLSAPEVIRRGWVRNLPRFRTMLDRALNCNEDQLGGTVAPVGPEFGSADFERMMKDDAKQFALDLKRWIKLASDMYVSHHVDVYELSDSRNVQLALHELGEDVTIEVANAVWKNYSQSLMAGWIAGAETVQAAARSIYLHCPRGDYPKY